MEVKWKDIQVKFVGQGYRSKVKVTRSKKGFTVHLYGRALGDSYAKEATEKCD